MRKHFKPWDLQCSYHAAGGFGRITSGALIDVTFSAPELLRPDSLVCETGYVSLEGAAIGSLLAWNSSRN